MRSTSYSLTLATADPDGVCQAQNPASNADMTINGALASGGVATFDVARRVLITSAGNDSAVTFTVYGTNRDGISIQEAITGTNASTAMSTKNFKTVTRIATAGDAANGITVGTTTFASGAWIPLCRQDADAAISVTLSAGASLTYKVEDTLDDVQNLDNIKDAGAIIPQDHSELVNKTANAKSNYFVMPRACRLTLTAFISGTATITVRPNRR